MKNMNFASFIFVAAAGLVLPEFATAQGGFARGFEAGSRAAGEAMQDRRADQQMRREAEAMRRQYGTPALDRLEALERTANRWAEELALQLARDREAARAASNR